MKKSKNMVYKNTIETQELQLYIDNTRVLYYHKKQVEQMLAKKLNRGIYRNCEAWKAFYKVCNHATELYNKAFGYRFTTAERYTVAVNMANDFVKEGYLNENSVSYSQ